MAKNKLSDLNDHLFLALERLGEEDMTIEQIEKEAKRAEAIIGVSAAIIDNAKITISAMKLVSEGKYSLGKMPEVFGIGNGS